MREPAPQRRSQVVTTITSIARPADERAWQDPAPTTRLARGSVPPADVSVTFVRPARKPTTLQMAVPPMPDTRASGSIMQPLPDARPSSDALARPSSDALQTSGEAIARPSSNSPRTSEADRSEAIVQPVSTRARRSSDLEALLDLDARPVDLAGVLEPSSSVKLVMTQRRPRRWLPAMIAVVIPAIALGAGAAYVYTQRTAAAALELDASMLPIARAVGIADDSARLDTVASLDRARAELASELADAERALAAHRATHGDVRAVRAQMDARRGELARVRRQVNEVAAQVVTRPARDPFANSTRSDVAAAGSPSPVLAQRLGELERRAGQLGAEVRALESMLLARAERSGDATLESLTDARDTLAVRLAALDRTADALRTEVDERVVAEVAHDQLPAVGTRVFACRVELLACRDAGEVTAVLAGDVPFAHPYRGPVRGGRVELRIDDTARETLFLGAAPRI